MAQNRDEKPAHPGGNPEEIAAEHVVVGSFVMHSQGGQLSAAKVPFAVFDCAIVGDLGFRLADFSGPKNGKRCKGVVLVDHAADLNQSGISLLIRRLQVISAEAPTAILWLGALDARNIKSANGIELHTDIRTHLCLPELVRDDLLRIYRAVSARQPDMLGRQKMTKKGMARN